MAHLVTFVCRNPSAPKLWGGTHVIVKLPRSHRAYDKIVGFESRRNVILKAHKVGGSYIWDMHEAAAIPIENLEYAKSEGATIPRGEFTYSIPYFSDEAKARSEREKAVALGILGAPKSNPSTNHAAEHQRLTALALLHHDKAFRATSEVNRRKHRQASERYADQAKQHFLLLPKARQDEILAADVEQLARGFAGLGRRRRNPKKTFEATFDVAATAKQPAYVARKLIDAHDLREARILAKDFARAGKVAIRDVRLLY
jgi:hypothetical protein